MLFNQFHDLAAGSGIGVIYQDAQKDYDQVHWAANEITAKSLETVQAHVNTRVPAGRSGDGVQSAGLGPLRSCRSEGGDAFRGAGWHFDPGCEGHACCRRRSSRATRKTNTYHLLFRAEDVPSLGYEVLHAVPGKRAAVSDVKANGLTHRECGAARHGRSADRLHPLAV